MKASCLILSCLLLPWTRALYGQTQPTSPPAIPSACGPKNVIFNADEPGVPSAPPRPQPGKAQVFFIQDDGMGGENQHFTIKLGLDGAWAGAYKNNSYFAVTVDPGEHHVCANVQSSLPIGQIVALAHFTAEPGKSYYLRTRLIFSAAASDFFLDLTQPDSDEATYLISNYSQSIWKSRTKK